jgi:electron transport complex protein RnfB
MSLIEGVIVTGGIGLLCALSIAWVSHKFAVEIDEKLEKVISALPGANCGACGLASCANLAETTVRAVEEGEKLPKCVQGGEETIHEIEDILGVKIPFEEKKIATVICSGGKRCNNLYDYVGVEDCWESLALNSKGDKACEYGCLGHGSCMKACPFNAIRMNKRGLPIIDKSLCTACGTCVRTCPRKIIRLALVSERFYVSCSSEEKGKDVRKKCEIGCIACRLCEKVCPVDAVHVVDNLAVIDPEECIGCGECQKKCPRQVIRPFDFHPIFWKFKHLLRRL